MIKPLELEARVLQIVDQVNKKQPCEDSLVELKSRWPKPEEAARQIAGHANASHGEPILWIIGLDEKEGIIGANKEELANWIPQVESQFNELSPELIININVPWGNLILVALLFSTERAPFVVKNLTYGRKDGGAVALEVPWREGNKTRSARREDLIRLLVPISLLPSAEILKAAIQVDNPRDCPQTYRWSIEIQLYVASRNESRIFIPCHQCKIEIQLNCKKLYFDQIWLEPRVNDNNPLQRRESLTVKCTKTESIIDGAGLLTVKGEMQTPLSSELPQTDAEIIIRLTPTGVDRPIVIVQKLKKTELKPNQNLVAKWTFNKD